MYKRQDRLNAHGSTYILCGPIGNMDQYFHALINIKYMRRFIITLHTLFFVVSGTLYAKQLNTSDKKPVLRHVQGMKGIGLQGGKTAVGGEGMFVGDYYFSPQWKLSVALGREADAFKDYRYQSFFLQPMVGYTLYTHPKCVECIAHHRLKEETLISIILKCIRLSSQCYT